MHSPILALALGLCLSATPGLAKPQHYSVDPTGSSIDFTWLLGKDAVHGQMSVANGDVILDLADLKKCRVNVDVDATSAEAGLPFATQAMRGPTVLNTGQYPKISFRSSDVRRTGAGATVNGQITLRGVTRPISFAAEIYRPSGSRVSDWSHLTILLNGKLKRSEFGATGWSGAVGDNLILHITAQIAQLG